MNTNKESPRMTNRMTAIIVGILFIIGTAAGILSVAFTSPLLTAPDYLMKISGNETSIIIGALLILIMSFALAMVPVLMFPIFKKHNEPLALGYVVFRGALETVTSIVIAISWLLLLPLSQEYVKAGAPVNSYFQTSGALLQGAANLPVPVFVFGLGALIFYTLLYQTRLIPRWISVWGFIAIGLHLAAGLLTIFGLQTAFDIANYVMNLPILLQEMVMAVWLIGRGFDPRPVASLSAQPVMS